MATRTARQQLGASTLVAALGDLAQVSLHVAPRAGVLQVVSRTLLERICTLFAVPRGALFLTPRTNANTVDLALASRGPQIVALQGLSAAEALAVFPPPDVGASTARAHQLTYPITLPNCLPGIEGGLLRLDWGEQRREARAVEVAGATIPFAADVIAAVLASALLAERIAGIKTASRLAEEARTEHGQPSIEHLKADLLATVSHELRSPLAAIKGYAETLLLREDRLPREERHAFLRAI